MSTVQLSAHINFGGRCEAAFRFYEEIGLGKVSTLLTWRDSPRARDIPPDWQSKICHANLNVGENQMAGVDDPFESTAPPTNVQMLLDFGNSEDAELVFRRLAEQGVVKLPLQETFWSACYGIVVDQFGIRWEVACTGSVTAAQRK